MLIIPKRIAVNCGHGSATIFFGLDWKTKMFKTTNQWFSFGKVCAGISRPTYLLIGSYWTEDDRRIHDLSLNGVTITRDRTHSALYRQICCCFKSLWSNPNSVLEWHLVPNEENNQDGCYRSWRSHHSGRTYPQRGKIDDQKAILGPQFGSKCIRIKKRLTTDGLHFRSVCDVFGPINTRWHFAKLSSNCDYCQDVKCQRHRGNIQQ